MGMENFRKPTGKEMLTGVLAGGAITGVGAATGEKVEVVAETSDSATINSETDANPFNVETKKGNFYENTDLTETGPGDKGSKETEIENKISYDYEFSNTKQTVEVKITQYDKEITSEYLKGDELKEQNEKNYNLGEYMVKETISTEQSEQILELVSLDGRYEVESFQTSEIHTYLVIKSTHINYDSYVFAKDKLKEYLKQGAIKSLDKRPLNIKIINTKGEEIISKELNDLIRSVNVEELFESSST